MKIYPWLDSAAASVVGVTHALGEHCKVLNELEDTGWAIDGTESVDMLEETYVYRYIAEGMLLPEPENPVDHNAVAVYLRFRATKKSMKPQKMAVHIGYLPKESSYKKHIKKATTVKIRCCDMISGTTPARRFAAEVVDVPLKLTSREYEGMAMDLDLE
jgi:hypothetical protein